MKRKKELKQKQTGKTNVSKLVIATSPDKWKYYSALAIILLISFVVYLPVLQNGFVWDDKFYIENNPLIYSFNLKDFFSKYAFGNYHPVTILTLAIEYHFFGLNETGYHAVNLLLHLLNVILVFYAVFLLSDKVEVALVASLLFGIHPMHVESVAWASELKDLLYTFFFLASYVFYLKYLKNRDKKFYLFALLLFSVSLLSKAMAASLPVVLILTDYFKERKINLQTLLEKAPFFLLAIVFGIVAILAQKSSGAVQDLTVLSFPQRLVLATYGFITYLWKLFLPLNLSAYYPYPILSGKNLPVQYFMYLITFIGLVVFVFYSIRFSKKVFFGLVFFAITVFLVLQLLPVGGTIMADRYSYIPSIGIFYLAGEGFYLLWSKKFKFVTIILLSAFTVFFSSRTYARCSVWNNDMTLWNDVISQHQNVADAYYNRGIVFLNEKKYVQAFDDFNKAIELRPQYINAYISRGVVYMFEKKYEKALDDYNKAVELNPKYSLAYINRGIFFINTYRYEEAISNCSKVIAELTANKADAFYYRGWAEYYLGMKDAACLDMRKAFSLGYKPAGDALQKICK